MVTGSWKLYPLSSFLVSKQAEIQAKPVPAQINEAIPDSWVWKGCKDGMYSVTSGCHWLLIQNRVWDGSQDWKWVWHLGALVKFLHLIWLCLQNAIPTNVMRFMEFMPKRCGCAWVYARSLPLCFKQTPLRGLRSLLVEMGLSCSWLGFGGFGVGGIICSLLIKHGIFPL